MTEMTEDNANTPRPQPLGWIISGLLVGACVGGGVGAMNFYLGTLIPGFIHAGDALESFLILGVCVGIALALFCRIVLLARFRGLPATRRQAALLTLGLAFCLLGGVVISGFVGLIVDFLRHTLVEPYSDLAVSTFALQNFITWADAGLFLGAGLHLIRAGRVAEKDNQ
ncbi:MAG: hypothetical protein WCJ56_14550 [bacterium]